jgi:hypothetical protein
MLVLLKRLPDLCFSNPMVFFVGKLLLLLQSHCSLLICLNVLYQLVLCYFYFVMSYVSTYLSNSSRFFSVMSALSDVRIITPAYF